MRLLALAVFFMFYNCKNKQVLTEVVKPLLDTTKLYGRWMILDALRNNRPTQTINGAIFEINGNHIVHNLMGGENAYQFKIKDSTLHASDQTNYNIEYLNDSLLIINTMIQNYKFRMSLKKQPGHILELTESDTAKQLH